VALMTKLLSKANRPAESVALIGIATPVYAFLHDNGVPQQWAAIIAVVCGLVPMAISVAKDGLKPPDLDTEGLSVPPPPQRPDGKPLPAATKTKHETRGIDHEALDQGV
jgi:hypothetical protein